MNFTSLRHHSLALLASVTVAFAPSAIRADTVASLLGNFTINQYEALSVSEQTVLVRFAVVYGQLPALSELHNADANHDGITTQEERDAYVGTLAPGFADGLILDVDGARVPLKATHWTTSLPTEEGGFSLRLDVEFAGALARLRDSAAHEVEFSNQNYPGRIGWHEIVVQGTDGVSVFNTNAYSSSATHALTEALQSLPASGPLDERTVHFSAGKTVPLGATSITARPEADLPAIRPQFSKVNPSSFGLSESNWITARTKQLITAISAPKLEPRVAIWVLLGALLLGAVHALSPGHGKTIVGAYLIGSRGTPKHAAFLGLTVTMTHTIGVFAIGFATLYASKYVMPERLFPILGLISALLVLGMGVVLLVQRGRAASLAWSPVSKRREQPIFSPVIAPAGSTGALRGFAFVQQNQHGSPVHGHFHSHTDGTMHSHGGGAMHSHLPPGARGESVTLKSLLALGISGGLVPCPSAMVLLLAAIALNKTAYGMLLVLVFSVGLAMTLTLVGLAFLYARNRFGSSNSTPRWTQLLPVLSAVTITLLGIALSVAAVRAFAS